MNLRRLLIIGLGITVTLSMSSVAAADAFVACWVEERIDPFGATTQVTVCRLANGSIAELPEDPPPGTVNPDVGTDANGVCWFWTSRNTEWEILATFSNGDAILGIYVNGFLVLDTGRIPRCTSEPVISDPPPRFAWEAITSYIHDPPEPDLSPPEGRGLAGMETFVGIPVPGPWSDTITIPGYTIEVEVVVTALVIDWGDGNADTYPASAYPYITGYPDGVARHIYEVKTCDPPGNDRFCHPTLDQYPLTISYVWGARWRANGGPWTTVNVPPSSTTVDYPVAEAISTLTSTG